MRASMTARALARACHEDEGEDGREDEGGET